MSKVYLISSLCPLLGFKKELGMGLSLSFSTHLATQILIVGLLIHEVNVVLFLILVSAVPKSARLSMILIGQRMLHELVNVEKLLLPPCYP
jgi:hypothetical protein